MIPLSFKSLRFTTLRPLEVVRFKEEKNFKRERGPNHVTASEFLF